MDNGRMHIGDPTHTDAAAPSAPGFVHDAAARMSHSPAVFPGADPVPTVDAPLHVVPCDEGWTVRFEGSDTVAAVVSTKKEAMSIARTLGRERDLRVVEHGADGAIMKSH